MWSKVPLKAQQFWTEFFQCILVSGMRFRHVESSSLVLRWELNCVRCLLRVGFLLAAVDLPSCDRMRDGFVGPAGTLETS